MYIDNHTIRTTFKTKKCQNGFLMKANIFYLEINTKTLHLSHYVRSIGTFHWPVSAYYQTTMQPRVGTSDLGYLGLKEEIVGHLYIQGGRSTLMRYFVVFISTFHFYTIENRNICQNAKDFFLSQRWKLIDFIKYLRWPFWFDLLKVKNSKYIRGRAKM